MTSTTITRRQINATANHSKRTFTIRVDGAKYRTTKMSREEFNTSLYMTANDWQQYLKGSDYYSVK